MAYTEIAFERLLLVLEATRGTAITTPTHMLNLPGKLTPKQTIYRPKEARGTLVKNYRTKKVRNWGEWDAEGAADPNLLPVLFNMAIKPVTSPTTPSGATLSRLWTFTRSISADDIKTATLSFGDPNIQSWQGKFGTIDELTFKNDASKEEVAMVSAKGMTNFPTKISAPTVPASIAGDTLPGQQMALWIDTSSAIGTTAVTGRLISVEVTIPTGIDPYKYLAAGEAADFNYVGIGRKEFAPTMKLTLEIPDMTEYDHWAAATTLKVRQRNSGALIETTAGPVNWYNYIEFDMYGPLTELEWGENGGNRTVTFMIESQYDSTLAADFSVKVQSARTAL